MGKLIGNRWWVVAASVCGLLVGTGAINTFAFAIFLKPLTEDLGIGRGVFGSAAAMEFLATTVGTAILGWLLARWGTRRVMIPGLLLCALTTALQSTLTRDVIQIYAILTVNGLFFACQSPMPYSNVVAQWFDRQRGLALGIATAGVGLGVIIVPQLAAYLVAHFGWRMGYVGLGIAIVIIAWLPVALFLREPPGLNPMSRRAAARAAMTVLPGILARDAFKTWRFWSFTLAFFLSIVAINGTLTQVVALLTDRGLPIQVAVRALSAAGIALIFGRIFSGWCLDRFWGPYVAVCFFALPMAGIALLASGAGGMIPFVGTTLCGIGVGGDVDLMAFFISRYFGMKEYAKISGVTFALFGLANGVGPALSGISFDMYHSYVPIFIAYGGFLVVPCLIFLRLGAYPYPPLTGEPTGA